MASAELCLTGARVTREFREVLLDTANRSGITPNEFCILAAAEKLAGRCAAFPGVFRRGDFEHVAPSERAA